MTGGFIADPGTDFTSGAEKDIASRLNALGQKLDVWIHGISGARTPAHSISVGGFANDPHTQGEATDFGVNGSLRSSAGQITDAQLASVGLYRPFSGATEINHVQVKPGSSSFLGTAWDTVKDTLSPSGGNHDLTAAAANTVNDAAANGITSGLSDVGKAAGAVAGAVLPSAADIASAVFGQVTDAVGKDLLRWTLYAALVIGGVFLFLFGGARVLGAGPSPTS